MSTTSVEVELGASFGHVHEKHRHLLTMSDADRLAFLEMDRWIGYGRAREILDLFTRLMDTGPKIRPRNYLLVGEPNNGKTTIVRRFETLHGAGYVDENVDPVKPVHVAESPPSADEKGLYVSILERFWAPYKATSSAAALRYQVVHQLRACKTRILFIEEFHSLLAGSTRKQREVMNAIKLMSNETAIPIVGIGTAAAVRVLHTDPQHSSRFDVLPLPLWPLDQDFQRLLAGFERVLPLRKQSELARPQMATLVHASTGGNLGNVQRLLAACAAEAIEKGEERISEEMIRARGLFRPTSDAARATI